MEKHADNTKSLREALLIIYRRAIANPHLHKDLKRTVEQELKKLENNKSPE